MNLKNLTRLLLLALITAGIVLALVNRDVITAEWIEAQVAALGIWGPLAYIGVYLVAPALFVPGTVITLTGGAMFGPLWGTLYTLVGSVGGATLAFLISRHLAGDLVERRAGGALRRIKEGVEGEGWRFVAFVRLVPLFPFNLLNYLLGLTRIPLRVYALTSAVCMLPGIIGYVYLGYAGREALAGGEDLVRKILIAVAVFAVLAFLPIAVRRWRSGGTAPKPPPPGE